MNVATLYPWQQNSWQDLWRRYQQNRLPHALLLEGLEGLGQKNFAERFAGALLCNKPDQDGNVCGSCHSCSLLKAESHSDLLRVYLEPDATLIKIDQIREVVKFVNETALLGGYRVIIIHPASTMNTYAANALLKTLEEPTPQTLFMLINTSALRLPATIASRCQRLILTKPKESDALKWLADQWNETPSDPILVLHLAEGAPLKALDMWNNGLFKSRQELFAALEALSLGKGDPLKTAAEWQTFEIRPLLNLLGAWLKDLYCFKLTGGSGKITQHDYRDVFKKLAEKLSHQKILAIIDQVQTTTQLVSGPFNVNRQLLLEDLFLQWTPYVSR